MINRSLSYGVVFSMLLTAVAFGVEQSPLNKAKNIINETLAKTSQGATPVTNLSTFSEEDLLKVIDNIALSVPAACKVKLQEAKNHIIQALKDYKVTGISFTLDPNFALIYDSQNPCFNVYYKNIEGQVKKRTYYSQISSWGIKFELSLNLNLIFLTDTNFNFYDTDKIVTLGTGFDITAGFHFLYGIGANLTYAPFQNAPGGMVMIGFPLFGFVAPGLSLVSGGSITPCK